MYDPRPVLFVIGAMLTILAIAMLLPAALDGILAHADWQVFLAAAFVTGTIGGILLMACRGLGGTISVHQAFLLTTLIWLALPAFGALPFAFSELDMSYTDAFFEAMSGLTTTGSTVMVGLDVAPPGILIWRSILQWLGGIGIIVTAVAVLPILRVGGMQLFRMESSDGADKALPRVTQISGAIGAIYLALTAVCAAAYWAAGMSAFDAVAHAMTTIATGGFSTSDQSVGHFDSAGIDAIATVFMIVGSLPFLLYFQIVRGQPLALWRDSQVRWFLAIAGAVVVLLTAWQHWANDIPTLTALRYTSFNAVSILTGTGYATTDYGHWGGFAVTVFLFIMFIGGCAGSTSCGIKVFRFQVLHAAMRTQIGRLLQPHGVFIAHFNRQPIPEAVMDSVMSFFFLFALSFATLAVLLTLLGLDFLTAISGAATAIANVGPGLGETIGPAGNFSALPDGAKWLLAFGMLLGRLELFTVLVLFTPGFWRD